MKRTLFKKLEKREYSTAEKNKYVPFYQNVSALQTESCTLGPKTGFWFIGCYVDKDPDNLRLSYEGEDSMTPEVCFEFCKFHRQMRFFFLRHGKECTCARHYHKGSKGGVGACTSPCLGDNSLYCGGKTKESVYEMHDCNAVAYKPTDPNEAMDLATELTDNGVKFFNKGQDLEIRGVTTEGMDISTKAGGLKKGLTVVVLDPHNGVIRDSRAFLLDGWNAKSSHSFDVLKSQEEGDRLKKWVEEHTILNDIVLVGSDPRAWNYATLQWGASVEKALHGLGCPHFLAPPKGMGFAAVCSGKKPGSFASDVIVDGHVSLYGPVGTMADTRAYYMIDCQVSEWENEGECTKTCGSGLQLQTRKVTVAPAHGGQICPEEYERQMPCSLDPCPIDCGYSEWGGWSPCDASCGPGEQIVTRMVVSEPEYGGVVCNHLESNLLSCRECEIKKCPIHAEWEEWTDWGACSEFCGPGEKKRTRERRVIAQYGGTDVEGPTEDYSGCFLKHCPVDCEITDWADEGGCSLSCGSGLQKQTRAITQVAMHGAAECPTDLEQHLDCNTQPCPIDCVMSSFMDDGSCSTTCGGGKQLQYRYTKVHPMHGGVACPPDSEQFIDCNTHGCPVNCVFSQWTGFESCSTTCGPGSQSRYRHQETPAADGGIPCEGPVEQDRDCELKPCPIDCEWDEWTAWSECNEECGPGRHARDRLVAVHMQWGGKPCEGPQFEEEDCEKTPCPEECELTEWYDVGECSKVCGGGKLNQARHETKTALHGGECPTDLTRQVECNPYPCPIACEMNNWVDDSECTVTCGSGTKEQIRWVNQPAMYGAEACPADLDREIACNEQECPVDGVWDAWLGWSACSKECGPGISTRTRGILTHAEFGGVALTGLDYEEKFCQTRECPIDCEYADWSGWGTCSDACGPGVHYRNREIQVEAEHGGEGCVGPRQEEQACQIVACPIDCEVTEWKEDGDCSLTCGGGMQKFYRSVTVEAAHEGDACPSELEKQEPCNTWSCPVDCVVSDWLDDGSCSTSCGGGLQMQVKNIETAPAYGGALCPITMNQHIPCNEDPCPVNCEFDTWTGWLPCSASCGNGTQLRKRGKLVEEAHGGVECDGVFAENRDCEVVPCPIHCELEEWGNWSACDEPCGPGTRERSRGIATQPMYGGLPCEDELVQEEDCLGGTPPAECPVDCVVGPWGAVSECSAECGGGTLTEVRSIEVNSDHGGDTCPEDLERSVECNTQNCPVDCMLSGWTNSGTCSTTCGGGVVRQIKTVIIMNAFGGKACDSNQEQWTDCNTEACPVNCEWGQWTGWSPCSAACAEGTTDRTREITVHAAHGGADCTGPDTESEPCMSSPCPVDGVWDEWGEWSECGQQCGEGYMTANRGILTAQAYGGLPLDGLPQKDTTCMVKACPIDCELGPWQKAEGKDGECTETCGGGVYKEVREVVTEAQHDGFTCPTDRTRDVPCNEDPCPVDCVLTDFEEVMSCSVSCGGGFKKFQRRIVTPQQNGGGPCDAPFEKDEDCNEDACPVDCVFGQWSGWGPCDKECGPGSQERVRGFEVEVANGGVACEGHDTESRECEVASCAIDGTWGDWSDWTECDSVCGPGQTKRSREIASPPQFGGSMPEGEFAEVDECESDGCPVDCVMSEWEAKTDCTVSCGGGTLSEERTVQTEKAFEGEACPTDTVREVPCNADSCPIDCEMSDWFDDGSCSVTCGTGEVNQVRTVWVAPSNGGAECEGERSQVAECSPVPCPIDCVWDAWEGWETCSHTCGTGTRKRTRGIKVEADYGGAECEGPTEEVGPCNEFECPVDCVLAEWDAWYACSEQCGPGLKYRMRGIAVAAKFGGAECDGERLDEAACEVEPCPQDCEMSNWEDVEGAACSKSCGQGIMAQIRHVTKPQVGSGAACPDVTGYYNLLQANGTMALARLGEGDSQHRDRPCNIHACPVDCEIDADWYADGECSLDCGGGQQTFRKNVARSPSNGGVACPESDSAERLKVEDCNTQPCPIDCVLTEWSGWGTCSATCSMGQQQRTREVATAADHGGVECDQSREESQSCKVVECPIHCTIGPWTAWSACDAACGPGTQTRTRSEEVQAQHGGLPCKDETEAVQDCEDAPCPVHCELSDWTNEGDCSATCGGGEQKQIRTITTDADHGGEKCDTNREQTVPCETQVCPVDCQLEEDWVEDGSCSKSCGTGKQLMRKAVAIGAANGGVACPAVEDASRKKEEDCNTHDCPVDCVVSAFDAWGECSTTCAAGQRTRSREVTTQPANGGAACPDPLEEIATCDLGPCPVDCAVSDWEDWGACDVTCGAEGVQQRGRSVVTEADRGLACPSLIETRNECPGLEACPVHCVMSAWEAWSDCSTTCGMGSSERTRSVTTDAANGGTPCSGTTESTVCDAGICPVDCKVSDWSASGTCSHQCGGGEQTYVKMIETQAVGMGTPCPAAENLTKTEVCNTHACPWSPVGEAGMVGGIQVIKGVGTVPVQFHMNYQTQPAVFFGPAPRASENEGFAKVTLADMRYTGVSLLQSNATKSPKQPACNPALLQRQPGNAQPTCADLGLSPPVVQEPVRVGGPPTGAVEACKCIGPEAGDILFGANNHQYPTLYGKYCFPWPARDPSAAMAQANGDVKLLYLGGGALGDGWAYNPVTKMRVYVASLVDLTVQKPGEPVIFPEGVGVPDAPDPNAIFPSGEDEWCYVGADCPGASKDGFHTWELCGKAWDSRPGVPYPNDPETCPVLGYDGPQVELTALTRKNNGDVCVGAKGDNSCHDPAPTGGSEMGFVSSIQMSPNMIMLQRAVNDDASDTCVFPQGEMEKWCKADGEYGSPTDLGWIFTQGIAGTTPLIGKFNKGSQDSCANTDTGDMSCGVTASATSTTPAKYPVKLGTMGFLLKSQAEGAWRHCHNFEHYHATNEPDAFAYGLVKAAKRRGGAWSVSASVTVEGPSAESMKVAWMAFAQGVYETAADTIFQVGIAPIVADGEVKTVPLHSTMSTAPVVIAQPIGSAIVRQRESSTEELYFIADGDGETVMVQWIAFEPTDSGYFGSVPFVAGMLDGASGEEKTWPDGEFTQPPLVFASVATDRTDGDVSVRIVNNTPESTIFLQEGTQTDEKVAYMAYNGKGQGGAVVNAETVHIQTYTWSTYNPGTGCNREGASAIIVTCRGSNGKTYDPAYCTAFAGTDEPDSSTPCTGDESIIETEGKCLEYSKKSYKYSLADCSGEAAQRFQVTSKGQVQNAKDGRCLSTTANGVMSAGCSEVAEQQWSFDEGKLVSATSDTSCVVVDPSSKVNILMGECGSQVWEAKKPVLLAKTYGYLELKGWAQCLQVIGTTVKRGSCAFNTMAKEKGKIVYEPGQMWTLTVNDELQTDDSDLCLTTTGLLDGEWADGYKPNAPPSILKLDGNKITSEIQTGNLGKLPNGDGTIDGNRVTWKSSRGTETATFYGDTLVWTSGNTWTRVAPALAMAACNGASNQKWSIADDGGEVKSLLADETVLSVSFASPDAMSITKSGFTTVNYSKVKYHRSWTPPEIELTGA